MAEVLQSAGYTVFLQDFDIPRGANFVMAMHDALKRCRHLVVMLTEDYDQSQFTLAEVSHFIAAAAARGGRAPSWSCCELKTAFRTGCLPPTSSPIWWGVNNPQERRHRILAAAEGRTL